MFTVNDDKSIYITRGDILFLSVTADNEGEIYMFQPGEVVRIKVFGKKDCESVVLQKDFPVTTETDAVEIYLTEQDTKIGGVISKPVDYWYEIELNPFSDPQTIIGYDDDGAKIFKLFPEGRDLTWEEPAQEDIPVVDEELDLTSTRPVQNQAIARAIVKFQGTAEEVFETEQEVLAACETLKEYVDSMSNDISSEISTMSEDIDKSISALYEAVKGHDDAMLSMNENITDLQTALGNVNACVTVTVLSDFNTFTSDGLFYFNYFAHLNSPVESGINGFLRVYSNHGNGFAVQLFFQIGSSAAYEGGVYIRSQYAGTWGGWRKFTLESV